MKTKSKVILSITVISAIMCLFCISCFATIQTLETDVTYDYVATYTRIDAPLGVYSDYQGRYIGQVYIHDANNNNIRSFLDLNFVALKTYDSNTMQKRWLSIIDSDNNEYFIQLTGDYPTEGKITFTSIGSNSYINNFLNGALTEHVNTYYDNSYDLLYFVNNTFNSILSYMTTNTITLICICIVIVSLGVGFLIRITRVN